MRVGSTIGGTTSWVSNTFVVLTPPSAALRYKHALRDGVYDALDPRSSTAFVVGAAGVDSAASGTFVFDAPAVSFADPPNAHSVNRGSVTVLGLNFDISDRTPSVRLQATQV